MSTQITICKKPSGHNLQITVQNPGQTQPQVKVLEDNQFTEVMIHGDGTIDMCEVLKAPRDD